MAAARQPRGADRHLYSWRSASTTLTREARRAVSIALGLSVAMVGCGSRFDRGTLPPQLSDDAFWALVTELSEPPGAFSHSDNLVSNEILLPHTVRQLRARG